MWNKPADPEDKNTQDSKARCKKVLDGVGDVEVRKSHQLRDREENNTETRSEVAAIDRGDKKYRIDREAIAVLSQELQKP